MKGKIIVCTFEDLSELKRISIETFSDTFASENEPADLQQYLSEAYGYDKLKKEMAISDTRFYFIYLADEVSGYLKLNTGDAQTEMLDKDGLEVERIYIRDEFKRQGLGEQLLNYAFDLAYKEKRTSIWLGVWEENKNALHFYQEFGFKKVGTHDFVLGADRQTDLIMMKELL